MPSKVHPTCHRDKIPRLAVAFSLAVLVGLHWIGMIPAAAVAAGADDSSKHESPTSTQQAGGSTTGVPFTDLQLQPVASGLTAPLYLVCPPDDPVIEYPHPRESEEGVGSCIIGGYVYRGKEIPSLQGQYVFADWVGKQESPGGVLLVAKPLASVDASAENDGRWPLAVAVEHSQYILGFGEDFSGELYVLSSDRKGPTGTTGRVWRVSRKQ